MGKKGGEFEIIANEFLVAIFTELGYTATRKRTQDSGTQDGFDNLIEIVDNKFNSYTIYSEYKDYSSNLHYSEALLKIPHIVSTHSNIDLLLFLSPLKNFSNTNENSKLHLFYQILSEDCPVEFLTPESYIKEYFSLYPQLYKKVYKVDAPDVAKDKRDELLNKFNKFIFSSRNLKKVLVSEEDRPKFIGTLFKEEFHIERSFRKFQDNGFHAFEDPNYRIRLDDYINKAEVGIFVLGNPGSGKSRELKNLAVDIWEKRDENFKIPCIKYLKSFSNDTTIESLLPKDFKYISYLTVIFDGLDEVHNIIDFTNKLRNFIADNSDIIKKKKIKFIISCRTNIYSKYVKDLSGFEVCFINEITEKAAFRFLLKKFKLDLNTDTRFNFWKYKNILENPFYLELIGEHYKRENEILLKKSILIEKYVQSRLEDDENLKFINDNQYEKDKNLIASKKIALSMEAMQRTSITKSEIIGICETADIYKNPFLEQDLNSGEWYFEHKNIQEYFVAKILSTLPFKEIIEFIRIDKTTKKIHPTWINVVSFLLNMDLPTTMFNKIVEWISENDIQFIFEADYDRINEEIRVKCLQQFFEDQCVKNELWIYNTSEIGRFGNVEENVSYLIQKIADRELHIRAKVSAISLLTNMSKSSYKLKELKNLLKGIVLDFTQNSVDKGHLIFEIFQLIKSSDLINDFVFYQDIINQLKPLDYKEVVDAIIYSVPDPLIEQNIDYLLEILSKCIGEKKWVHRARVRNVLSRKDDVFDLFRKITNPDLLLTIYSFLIERHDISDIRENQIKEFLLHLKGIFINSPELINNLISIISNAIIEDKIRYYEDDLLVDLILSCNIEKEVFFVVFDKLSGNYSQKMILADIVKEEYFSEITNKYNSGLINDDFLQGFRNLLTRREFDLGIAFENSIESFTVYRFNDKMSREELEMLTQFYKSERQREFDVLFDRGRIEKQMSIIFEFKEKVELTYAEMKDFYKDFTRSNNLRQKVTMNVKHLLMEILRNDIDENKALHVNDLLFYIEKKELDIMVDILNVLPTSSRNDVKVSSDQEILLKTGV